MHWAQRHRVRSVAGCLLALLLVVPAFSAEPPALGPAEVQALQGLDYDAARDILDLADGLAMDIDSLSQGRSELGSERPEDGPIGGTKPNADFVNAALELDGRIAGLGESVQRALGVQGRHQQRLDDLEQRVRTHPFEPELWEGLDEAGYRDLLKGVGRANLALTIETEMREHVKPRLEALVKAARYYVHFVDNVAPSSSFSIDTVTVDGEWFTGPDRRATPFFAPEGKLGRTLTWSLPDGRDVSWHLGDTGAGPHGLCYHYAPPGETPGLAFESSGLPPAAWSEDGRPLSEAVIAVEASDPGAIVFELDVESASGTVTRRFEPGWESAFGLTAQKNTPILLQVPSPAVPAAGVPVAARRFTIRWRPTAADDWREETVDAVAPDPTTGQREYGDRVARAFLYSIVDVDWTDLREQLLTKVNELRVTSGAGAMSKHAIGWDKAQSFASDLVTGGRSSIALEQSSIEVLRGLERKDVGLEDLSMVWFFVRGTLAEFHRRGVDVVLARATSDDRLRDLLLDGRFQTAGIGLVPRKGGALCSLIAVAPGEPAAEEE